MSRRFVAWRPCVLIEALEPRNMMSANHAPVAVISTWDDAQYPAADGAHPAWENDAQGLNADNSFDPDGKSEQLTYEWDANNDGIFEQQGMRGIFYPKDQPGDYLVTLRVTDQHGASSTVTNIMRVKDVKPLLELHYRPYAIVGETRTFSDEYFLSDRKLPEFDKIASMDWDLNYDGVTFDSDVVADRLTVNFNHTGVYQFASRVIDDDGDVGITVVHTTAITHASKLEQVIFPHTVQAGEQFRFQTLVTNEDVPNINFSDWNSAAAPGLGSNGYDPSLYSFEQPGQFTVTVTVQSLAGEYLTCTQQVTVVAPPAPPAPTPVVVPTVPEDDSKDHAAPSPTPDDEPVVVLKDHSKSVTQRQSIFASTTHTITWAPMHTSSDREDAWRLVEAHEAEL